MHDTGCLGLVHWDDPEGWYEEGGGFRMANTCIPVPYMTKPIQYCKVINLQFKLINLYLKQKKQHDGGPFLLDHMKGLCSDPTVPLSSYM